MTPCLGKEGQKTVARQRFIDTGVSVTYATKLGPAPIYPNEYASTTHYQGIACYTAMMKERPGDRVQMCFVGGPAPTKYGNLDSDDRGRQFCVWDDNRKARYWGSNAEHSCGGR